ncbi:UTP--glucose-1-phosphate uridylyltransferase [Pseudodesulfovibrio portus]|uniref:UTP--glucose-1-phosphate uridylyltransferase n=1 Tax=Pseudodesulfovibrio portus TaxID=231439 RepID=A0ABN6RVF6_9BACT|nr:UTP--glucose-1-phosphate uridylyltransferase [Pseudodesulfovibrio portus]BDQ33475.1 UTP--glucose-1-phosphate uridylyltransferase [Pseudodesulfovibrio portus]
MTELNEKQMQDRDFHACFASFAQKMAKDGTPAIVINGFKDQMRRFFDGDRAFLGEGDITPVMDSEVPEMGDLRKYRAAGYAALARTAIIKLNGGLGTSMGLDGPKSFLPVREGRTFLDLILNQVRSMREEFDAPLPLVLMNSFWTDEPTRKRLQDEINGDPHVAMSFVQHRYPRIRRDNLAPLTMEGTPELEWNPPGHGDIYTSLLTTGTLRRLLLSGYRYVFVSNSDNLGAVFDASLLGYMAKKGIPFLMEVCRRTHQDRKGGHLMKRNGCLGLREVAQCAPEDMDQFQDVNKYSFFNTNSIWIDLKAVEEAFLKRRQFDLELIVNPKRAIPGDPDSPEVIQLETAMGSAISLFPGAQAVVVPRSRFSPVKTIGDLMLTMSDCFKVTDSSSVVCRTDWRKLPSVSLDPRVYSTVGNFFSRFPEGVPSMAGCRGLSVKGDVRFQGDVTLNGRVSIINNTGRQAVIPSGHNLTGDVALV